MLPTVVTLLAFGLLCAFLIQGWSRQKHRALLASVIYFCICISYEAFYFQWIALGLLGTALIRAGRAKRREVAYSTTALVIAQLGAAFWHLYWRSLVAARFVGVNKPIVPAWPRILFGDLLTTLPSMFRSFGAAGIPFAIIALLLGALWLVNCYTGLRAPELRSATWTPLALAACCLAAGVLSIFAFALGGRGIQATGMSTRTLVLFNFWLVAAVGICVVAFLNRASSTARATMLVLLGALGTALAAGHLLRRADWAEAWRLETKILAEAPTGELGKTPANATILFIHRPRVNGVPIFTTPWDLNTAMPWKYPFLTGRVFLIYNPRQGALTWDGQKLAYEGHSPSVTAAELYVWRPGQGSFRKAQEPFRVTDDLTTGAR